MISCPLHTAPMHGHSRILRAILRDQLVPAIPPLTVMAESMPSAHPPSVAWLNGLRHQIPLITIVRLNDRNWETFLCELTSNSNTCILES